MLNFIQENTSGGLRAKSVKESIAEGNRQNRRQLQANHATNDSNYHELCTVIIRVNSCNSWHPNYATDPH